MITTESIFTVTIPEWVNKVRIGTNTAKFYTSTCDLPKKYGECGLKKIKDTSYYVDGAGKKIIKNSKAVGNPIYWTVNGQGFYNNTTPWYIRSKAVKYYHKYFTKYIKEQLEEQIPTFLEYKLSMHIDIYDVYASTTPDISNMWILPKMFEDAVVNANVIRDDSPEFRTSTSYKYRFVREESDRKLVITFNYIQEPNY